MATISPINAGPLKITFPSNLPRNEKDLICMILAGRLKDLLKGRLVCAQLAIDDLINDLTGVSPLNDLKVAMTELYASINDLKTASGADAMLGAINSSLSQIQNVFSLGGLCPSPIHAPQIPDVLKQLNNNLFGQTNNILNALAKVSNPKMCLGGGPGGTLGVNWNSMTGDLANLKRAMDQLINNPANYQSTINAFIKNIRGQSNRLKAELNRLKKNLADPFGINDAQQKARNIIAAKNSSDAYPIKTDKGIKIENAMKMLVTPDLEAAIAGDSDPIIVQTVPILDYCGDIVGFERTSNAPGYEGWSTEPDALNAPTPTDLPVATYSGYDYFIDDSSGSVKVVDSNGLETAINIERGNHYRIGVNVSAQNPIGIFSNINCTVPWIDGIVYNENSDYGQGIDIIVPDENTKYTSGYIDWMVTIESPQTPDVLYWKYSNNVFTINVSGITVIPFKDRVFNISNAMTKSMLHLKNTTLIDSALNVEIQDLIQITTDAYRALSSDGNIEKSTTLVAMTPTGIGYSIIDDQDVDSFGQVDEFNKVVRHVFEYPSGFLIVKKHINLELGFALNQMGVHISSDTTDSGIFESFIIKFDNPVVLSNMTSLEYNETYAYDLIHIKNGNLIVSLRNFDTMKFNLITGNSEKKFIRWNMTSTTADDSDNLATNDFIFQSDIEIDYTDISGAFTNSDPVEVNQVFYFKTLDNLIRFKLEKR